MMPKPGGDRLCISPEPTFCGTGLVCISVSQLSSGILQGSFSDPYHRLAGTAWRDLTLGACLGEAPRRPQGHQPQESPMDVNAIGTLLDTLSQQRVEFAASLCRRRH